MTPRDAVLPDAGLSGRDRQEAGERGGPAARGARAAPVAARRPHARGAGDADGGCNVSDSETAEALLMRVSRFNDRVQGWLFDPTRLAPTYPESMITRPFPFNAFYEIDRVPSVDPAGFRLKVAGRVRQPGPGRWSSLRRFRSRSRSRVTSASRAGVRSANGAASPSSTS